MKHVDVAFIEGEISRLICKREAVYSGQVMVELTAIVDEELFVDGDWLDCMDPHARFFIVPITVGIVTVIDHVEDGSNRTTDLIVPM